SPAPMTAELRRALCLAAAMLACGGVSASDDDAVPPGMARIKGPSAWSMKPSPVNITAIDGRPFSGGKLLLDPGHHVFSVSCVMHGVNIRLPDGSELLEDPTSSAE